MTNIDVNKSSDNQTLLDKNETIGMKDLLWLEDYIVNYVSLDESEENSYDNVKNSGIINVEHRGVERFRLIGVLNSLPPSVDVDSVINMFNDWFLNLPDNYAQEDNVDKLYLEFVREIREVNAKLFESFGDYKGKCSFSGVIEGRGKTVVASAGRTPVYTFHNGLIKLLDNLDLGSNDSFGKHEEPRISSTTLGSNDYSTLMLFSVGNFESIEDDRIKIINPNTDRDALAEELLDTSTKEKNGDLVR